MKIVFVTPTSFLRRIPVYRWGGKLYGHSNSITGPLVLGGILKRAGHQVEVYEELNGSVPYKKLFRDTDVFCFYVMTSTAPRAYELAERIHRESQAKVIMGGIHVTAMPREALQYADQVVVGEGEDVILDVVEGRIPDRLVQGKARECLDGLPLPDYSILKTPCESANIMTTRGCPYRCTFCTTSRMFAPYRQRSVENVIEELRIYKKMGFRYMNFEDDNFTADKERAKEICRRMIEENLVFKETFFFGRTDMANDEELLDLLCRAHLNRVLIGIESLNQEALDAIHKGQNIEDIRRAAAACKKHKIRVIASLVLGLDQDSREDIRRSVAFAKSMDAYQLQPAVLTPYPGTPVYKQFLAEGRLLEMGWEQFDMMNVTFQPKQLSPWGLQQEFYRAARVFYDIPSAFRIGRIFGGNYGARRLGFALLSRLGLGAAQILAQWVRSSPFYQLKRMPWLFDKADAAESKKQTPTSNPKTA